MKGVSRKKKKSLCSQVSDSQESESTNRSTKCSTLAKLDVFFQSGSVTFLTMLENTGNNGATEDCCRLTKQLTLVATEK